MSKSFVEVTTDISRAVGKIRAAAPGTIDAFNQFSKSALAPGALSALQKELIALGIGVASHCDGCIGFHVKTLVRLGVSREQLVETLGVAVYMGGGPSLMYAADAMRAYEEWQAKFAEAETATV